MCDEEAGFLECFSDGGGCKRFGLEARGGGMFHLLCGLFRECRGGSHANIASIKFAAGKHEGVRDELHAGMATAHQDARFALDRKSTRLNSSHVKISYAVFCLKKKINST